MAPANGNRRGDQLNTNVSGLNTPLLLIKNPSSRAKKDEHIILTSGGFSVHVLITLNRSSLRTSL